MGSTGDDVTRPVDLADATGENDSTRPGSRWSRRRKVGALVVVLALIAVGVGVALNRSDSDDQAESVDTFAPSITVGDANLVVLATTFDHYGARNPIPTDVVTTLAAIPGVKASEGVLRKFVPLRDANGETLGHGRTTIALSWNGTAGLDLREGRPPVKAGEVALDVDTLAEHGLHVGDTVTTPTPSPQDGIQQDMSGTNTGVNGELSVATATIVGAFSVAGGDGAVPGVALSAFDAGTLLRLTTDTSSGAGFDRIDLILAPDADPAAVTGAVAAALPGGTQVVPATQLGTREQLRAELEIQRAFYDMLSEDEATRNAAGEFDQSPEARAAGNATFQRYLSQVRDVEFRVQRVNFLDADHASLVFMTYYGGFPSPVLTEPFDAHAVRIDGRWKVANSTICTLALLGGGPCMTGPSQTIEPPPGWGSPESQPEVVDAFTRFAAPDATAATRLAVLAPGADPAVVEAGVAADAPYAATARLVVSGARVAGSDRAEIFYSLTIPGHPEIETPYPLVGEAVRVGGAWKVALAYQCGLGSLGNRGCPTSGGDNPAFGFVPPGPVDPTPTTTTGG